MITPPNPLILHRDASKVNNLWISPADDEPVAVEEAVAGWFHKQGYFVSRDYKYVLTALLLSLMFDDFRYSNEEDRAVYKHILLSGLMTYESAHVMSERRNLPLDQHKNSPDLDIANDHEARIRKAPFRSKETIESNLRKILPRIQRKITVSAKQYPDRNVTGLRPKKQEELQLDCALALLSALGPDGVIKLSRFRASKFRYRAYTSWPDLLVWNDKSYSFQEVKSPNDRPSDYQLETLAGMRNIGISCSILSVASSEKPHDFFDPKAEIEEPTIPAKVKIASLASTHFSLSQSFDDLLVGISGVYSLAKEACEIEGTPMPEDLQCFLTSTDGCRYPYEPETKPTSFFSNGHSDRMNSLLVRTQNLDAAQYHDLEELINTRKSFILKYLSKISLFEMTHREYMWDLPRVRVRETASIAKFDLSIDRNPIGTLVTKPFFMKKVIPTLEFLSQTFPCAEEVSEQEFLSWYLFSGNGDRSFMSTPTRARNIQEAVFKFSLFHRILPAGPLILQSDKKFPGESRLHDKRFKLPITDEFILAVRKTVALFEDMGTIKLRTRLLGYTF